MVTKNLWGGGLLRAAVGDGWTVTAVELGVFVANLAVRPDEESGVIWNTRLAAEGKKAVAERKRDA